MPLQVKTIIEKSTPESIIRAATIIKKGGLVAFPTETVYGLGANGLDGEAAARIYMVKGRPADNPLILHIASKAMGYELVEEVSPQAQRLMDAFWPGALTLILPKKPHIPTEVSCGLNTVGVRMPAHPVALDLILASGVPLAAPSANVSGRPSPTLASHVAHDLEGTIDMILDGGATDWGLESTVAEVSPDGVCVLRPGAVTIEQLREIVPNCWLDKAIEKTADAGFTPKAPGMKYRHYSPEAEVILVTGSERRVLEYIHSETASTSNLKKIGILATEQTLACYTGKCDIVLSLGNRENPITAAAGLFRCLREFDVHGIRRVYVEGIDERGLGLAVMNRLKKAAVKIVKL